MRAIPTLKISISGVRGVIGESLTPTLLTRFAQAFGTYIGSGTVVIGRDPRTSGEMVKQAVIGGLLSSGCRVSDIGMCPVPTVQLLVRQNQAQGGIAITASHNPAEWNIPKYWMIKEKLDCPSNKIAATTRMIRHEYAGYPTDTRDGVKVELPAGWFLVRGSNTEPIIRVVAEAASEDQAREIVRSVRDKVEACINS